jgi:hypothetical protein
MLSWIPLLGPILQGLFSTVSSIYGKFKDTQIEQIKGEVVDAQTAAQIIHDTNDDIGLRILRDTAIVFPVLWSAIIGYDTIITGHWSGWAWIVENYPPQVQYIPYSAFAFLFGLFGFKIWKGKL